MILRTKELLAGPKMEQVLWSETGISSLVFWGNILDIRTIPPLLDRFVNKLNLYGFKKVYQDGDEECFKNKFFLKGQVGLLPLIKRSKGGDRVLTKDPTKKNGIDSLQEKIDQLSQKYNNLEEVANQLIVQNGRITEENKYLIMDTIWSKQNIELKIQKMMGFFSSLLRQKKNRNYKNNRKPISESKDNQLTAYLPD